MADNAPDSTEQPTTPKDEVQKLWSNIEQYRELHARACSEIEELELEIKHKTFKLHHVKLDREFVAEMLNDLTRQLNKKLNINN